MVVYHLQKISGKSSWKVDGTRLFGSSQPKISGSIGTSEKVVLFLRMEYSKAIFDTSFRPSRPFSGNVSVKSKLQHAPPGIPRAFDTFALPGRREFDHQSLPGGGEFDPHALGVGNLNSTIDFMLACVASVSSRGSSRKLGQEQKKKNE